MALAMRAWLTAELAVCPRRPEDTAAAVDEAFGLMEKACLSRLDSM
jgi:hypothetical protein